MGACPKNIVTYMHAYLDGDISATEEKELRNHLNTCEACQKHMSELEHVVHTLESLPAVAVPMGFSERVMLRLPKPKVKSNVQRWLRRHPMLVAVAIFAILMSGPLLSGYNSSSEFSVTDYPGLIVKDGSVVVPENETIKGDIIVKNGTLEVKGKVDGDITVVNGKYMASAANVTGQVKEVDETFEWLWYTIKDRVTGFFSSK